MLDIVRTIRWMLLARKANTFPKPLTGTIPSPGQSLPPVASKASETQLAHGTIASDQEDPNCLATEEPTEQLDSERQMAQEDWQQLGSMTRSDTEDSTRILRKTLEKAQEEIRNLRAGLEYNESEANGILHKKNAKYNQYIKTTTTALEQLRAENVNMQEIVRKTHFKLQAKEEELQKCKDELFDLQPPSQVSDAQIGKEWERLCGNITSWIDDQGGGTGSVCSELKKLRHKDEFKDSVVPYWGNDRQDLVQHASHYPYIIDVLIRYNIHCLLDERIFDESVYMFGLRRRSAELLTMLEKQMNALEPRRGKVILPRKNEEQIDRIVHRSGDYR